jgi:hypothetical protein
MLPFFQLPMRCHDCIKRDYRNMFAVLKARSAERERRRLRDLENDSSDTNTALSGHKS